MKLLNIHRNYSLPFREQLYRCSPFPAASVGISWGIATNIHMYTLTFITCLCCSAPSAALKREQERVRERASMSMSLSSVSCLLPVPSNCILRFVRNSARTLIHILCKWVRVLERERESACMWQLFLFDQMQRSALGTVECVKCHACKINMLGKYQNADASRWKQTLRVFAWSNIHNFNSADFESLVRSLHKLSWAQFCFVFFRFICCLLFWVCYGDSADFL